MQYRVRRRNNDLEHGLFSKAGAKLGSTWDKHKYIAKQKVGDGYRYFYSQAELAAAKAKKAGQKVAGVASDAAYSVKRTANKVGEAAKKGVDIVTGKYARNVRDNIRRANENFDNELDRAYATLARLDFVDEDKTKRVNAALERRQNALESASLTSHNAYVPTKTLAFKISKKIALSQDYAKYYIKQGKKSINDLLSKVDIFSKNTISKGKSFIKKLRGLEGQTVNKNKSSKKNSNTISEEIIKETIIPEEFVYEDVIEDKPHLISKKRK